MIGVGKGYSEKRSFNKRDVNDFAELTGDKNYLHLQNQENYGRFKGPVVHGAFISGQFSKILGTKFPGPGTIYKSQALNFYKPLYIGSEATFSVEVVESKRNGKCVIYTKCECDGDIVCDGQSEILYRYVTKEDIINGLYDIGLSKGDSVLVHSSFKSFGHVVGGPNSVIDALTEVVGIQGAVIFPTFNFDFTKSGIYDYKNTKSKMGIITEIARCREDAKRIYHPMYSFAVLNDGAKKFENICNVSSYGRDSVFGRLRDVDGKILILGLSYNDSMTFFHHVEEMVGCDYRYMKDFYGYLLDTKGNKKTTKCSTYVRDIKAGVKTMVNPMGKELENMGVVSKGYIGNSDVKLMKANDVFDYTKDVVISNPNLLRII